MANDPESSDTANNLRPISLAEQAEELRAELKPGALTDPAEHAEAQRQLDALPHEGQPESKEQPRDSAALLEDVKHSVAFASLDLYRKEQNYLQSVEGFSLPSQADDKLKDSLWEPATNERDAASRLISTYVTFRSAKDTEQQSLANLEDAVSTEAPELELRPLISEHLQALYAANDAGGDVHRSHNDYQSFRDQPNPGEDPTRQQLRELADAIVAHRDAEYSLFLLDDDKIEPEERDDAKIFLDQTTRILNEKLTIYKETQTAVPTPLSDSDPHMHVDQSEPTPANPKALLDQLKEAATNGDYALWQKEREYLSTAGEPNIPGFPSDVYQPDPPKVANETEALLGLKSAHEGVLDAQTIADDQYNHLKASIADGLPDNDLHTIVRDHFQASRALDELTLDLSAAEEAYKPFRDDPEPNADKRLQTLRSLINAYESHESACHNLGASIALNEEPEKIAAGQARLDHAKTDLQSKLFAYDAATNTPLSEDQFKLVSRELAGHRAEIRTKDPTLAAEIWNVEKHALFEPAKIREPDTQTRIAYALQDAEKIIGKLPIPNDIRAETTRLAADSPGLENKQLQSLLAQTATINDPVLVRDLRDKAKELVTTSTAASGPDQSSATDAKTRDEIYSLGFRVATAPRVPQETVIPESTASDRTTTVTAPSPSAAKPQGNRNPPQDPNRSQGVSSAVQLAQKQISAFDEPRDATNNNSPTTQTTLRSHRSPSTESTRDVPHTETKQNQVKPASEDSAATNTPASNEAKTNGTPANITYNRPATVSVRSLFGGPFPDLMKNIREASQNQTQQPASSAQQTQQASTNNSQKRFSVAGRLDDHIEAKRTPTSQNTTLQNAHDAASVAIEQIQALRASEAGAFINKINDAAATTKGGINEVLSELRTGGKYEDLRKEFNHLYSENDAFRSAYDRAATALSDYGAKRAAVNNTIGAQPHDQLAGKIKALDTQIAEATKDIPGTTDGKTITEKMAENAREVVEAIFERLRQVFDRKQNATPNASPSPSP